MSAAPPEPAADAEVERLAAGFVDALATERFAEAFRMLDPKMAEALPESQLIATWRQLEAQLGRFVSAAPRIVERKDGLARVTFEARHEKTTVDVLVVLSASHQVTGFFVKPRPVELPWSSPTYADPGAFVEEAVIVGDGELALPGTLSLPRAPATSRLRAVVLVHGSGPNDRDETIGASKPFKDIAWGLASRGIAVLRYEKVTRAHGPAVVTKWGDDITLARDTVDDALAAVDLLRKDPRIDPARIVYAGHSQGAYAAPLAALRDPTLAGLVLLAAPSRRFEDVVLRQVEYLATLGGANGEGAARMLPALREAVARVKGPDLARTPRSDLPLGLPAPFWLDVRDYEPVAVAATLPMPILVLQGGADYQVDGVDFAGWQEGLRHRPRVTTKRYPGLLHSFVDGGCALGTPADYLRPGNVDPRVIADIADWVAAL